ncbi:sensor histidine kinase [Nocardia yamanashiensis]|uniref:ATP-binding protein n=1 Tax=Nocardia yamanashiensis TaxID=209247 RepID=UPI001E3720E6|nr:histidine kinase [Nocardia yamanashiensis]UGT43521.1 sensor histidine kinase [Nocardia yamanashiensis]
MEGIDTLALTAATANTLARTRLRVFLLGLLGTDVVLIACAGIISLRGPNWWAVAMVVLLAVEGALLLVARRQAERGELAGSATTISVAVWTGAIVASYLSPFTLPIHVVAVLLPAIFAVPYVGRKQLRRFMFVTIGSVTACGVIAAPLVVYPPLALKYVASIGLPAVVAMILLVLWHTAATMREIAVTAQHNADALASSQRLLAERADQLTSSRARLVAATDAERRRLERDLHDGAQQHLVAVAVTLQLARQLASDDAGGCSELLGEAADLVQTAIAEIRRLAHGIYPPLLAADGLRGALPAAAGRCPVPVHVDAQALGRYSVDIETALYYCCLEALQNSVKHGGPATAVTITARQSSGTLTVTIADTGSGFDPTDHPPGAGLTNMRDRLAVIGGTLDLDSAPGTGTRLTATVPAQPLSPSAESRPSPTQLRPAPAACAPAARGSGSR